MSREAMQLALDVIATPHPGVRTNLDDAMIYREKVKTAIEELRAALAQPEPAECDGGQCGIGGYCKECPKTQSEQKQDSATHSADSAKSFCKPAVPVCWMNASDIDRSDWKVFAHGKPSVSMPLYASPLPQREWVGLTGEEAAQCWNTSAVQTWKAIEAKLKEKNTL